MSVQQEKQREASLRKESKGWRKTEEQQGMVGEDYNTNQLLPENSPGKELMDQHYKRSIAELESAQLRQKCQYFKKYGNLQEREAHNTNR